MRVGPVGGAQTLTCRGLAPASVPQSHVAPGFFFPFKLGRACLQFTGRRPRLSTEYPLNSFLSLINSIFLGFSLATSFSLFLLLISFATTPVATTIVASLHFSRPATSRPFIFFRTRRHFYPYPEATPLSPRVTVTLTGGCIQSRSQSPILRPVHFPRSTTQRHEEWRATSKVNSPRRLNRLDDRNSGITIPLSGNSLSGPGLSPLLSSQQHLHYHITIQWLLRLSPGSNLARLRLLLLLVSCNHQSRFFHPSTFLLYPVTCQLPTHDPPSLSARLLTIDTSPFHISFSCFWNNRRINPRF